MSKILLHTPDGVRDIYGKECSDRKYIISKIHDKMESFGYSSIETPTFEFFDVFAEEINASDTKELYKFFDKEGNTLVLRPDFTPSIARCASKVMLENGNPVRVCYEGNSFLNVSNLQGKLKENCNIGVELMNDSSVYADAEAIALLIESLKSSGLSDFQVSVGDADYYKGLCAEAGITPETEEEIREQIIGKNYFAAEAIMREKNIPDKYSELIVKVSEFIGSDDALDKAASQVHNERSLAAISRLKELYKVLTYYGVEKYISFDLGILSRFNYYTGRPAFTAVTAVGSAFGQIFGAMKVHTSSAALSGAAVNLDIIDEVGGHSDDLFATFAVNDALHLNEDILHIMVAVDGKIVALVQVIMGNRLRLVVVHGDAVTDGVEVVIGTSAYFTALNETLDKQLFVHQQVNHRSLHVVFLEQLRQRLCLRHGTGITIEDGTLAVLGQISDIVLNDAVHDVVRNEVSFGNQSVYLFAQFTAGSNLCAEHIACRNMLQAVKLYNKLRLRTFTATRSTRQNNIYHSFYKQTQNELPQGATRL